MTLVFNASWFSHLQHFQPPCLDGKKKKEREKKGKIHENQESPHSYFYHTMNIDSSLIFIEICQSPVGARLISLLPGMVGYQYNCYHQWIFTILSDISAPVADQCDADYFLTWASHQCTGFCFFPSDRTETLLPQPQSTFLSLLNTTKVKWENHKETTVYLSVDFMLAFSFPECVQIIASVYLLGENGECSESRLLLLYFVSKQSSQPRGADPAEKPEAIPAGAEQHQPLRGFRHSSPICINILKVHFIP